MNKQEKVSAVGALADETRAYEIFDQTEQVLNALGFEPGRGRGAIKLKNCPFAALAKRNTEVICGINQHLVQSILDAKGESNWRAVLDKKPGYCCVEIRHLER